MFVIFDLDGTLALTEHRAHYLQGETKDWRAFYAACDADKPFKAVMMVLYALVHDRHRIEIWSGRSGEVAEKTAVWLRDHGLGLIPVKMRPPGDHRPDTVLKKEWLDAEPIKPDLVFEDRASMVAMWRGAGIVCCQVAEGAF